MLERGPVSMDEDEEEGGEEADSCEGIKSVVRKSPKEPTKVDKEEYERTRCPYRSWCEHCVRARARSGHHRSCVPVGSQRADSALRLFLHEQRRRISVK